MRVVFLKVVDARCFSHAIDCVGEHFSIPILKRFLQLWNSLFGHSPTTWSAGAHQYLFEVLFADTAVELVGGCARDHDTLC